MRLPGFINKLLLAITPSTHAWRGAGFALLLAGISLCIISAFDLFENTTPSLWISAYFLTEIAMASLLATVFFFFLFIAQKIPSFFMWSLLCFISILYYFFIPQVTSYGLFLVFLWLLFSLSLFGGSIYTVIAAFSSKQKPQHPLFTFTCVFVGALSTAALIFWLFANHTAFTPPKFLKSPNAPPLIALPNPALPGQFSTEYLSYGSGEDTRRPEFGKDADIQTTTVDGSAFVRNWDGFFGRLRSLYWGFDVTTLPLNAQVWYPKGAGPFPLVIIVHGNHEMTAASDSGYVYLAELLASRGLIVASIDENFLNTTWHSDLYESPGRGWLILEHLKLWRRWNHLPGNPFYSKVNMDRIALIGHSRGGEAIAAAAALNDLHRHPDNGNITFDYGFNIKALAAIAPTDGQFKPGGVKIKLNNIDYLVLQGSHDGDVRSFEGAGQFHRISFNDKNYHFKSALYILGANHGQFNTLWKDKDNSPPTTLLFELGQLLPEKQQQQIAQVYISAFLEASLNEEHGYLPLFQNYQTGKEWLPETLYLNEFADSTFQYIDNDDKIDLDMTKTSLAGGTQKGDNLRIWRQGRVPLKNGGPIQIGIYLGWNTFPNEPLPAYTIHLPENGLQVNADSILVLDLADGNDTDTSFLDDDEGYHNATMEALNKNNRPIDFSIELSDQNGHVATMLLSDFAYLQPALDVNLMKASFLDPVPEAEFVFQTFEFPLSSFLKRNPNLNPNALATIKFIFNKSTQGLIIIDSIAFRQSANEH